jgi:hypothetical protein
VCPGLSVSHPILSKNVVFFDSICHNLLGILACTSRLRKGENGGCIKIKKIDIVMYWKEISCIGMRWCQVIWDVGSCVTSPKLEDHHSPTIKSRWYKRDDGISYAMIQWPIDQQCTHEHHVGDCNKSFICLVSEKSVGIMKCGTFHRTIKMCICNVCTSWGAKMQYLNHKTIHKKSIWISTWWQL